VRNTYSNDPATPEDASNVCVKLSCATCGFDDATRTSAADCANFCEDYTDGCNFFDAGKASNVNECWVDDAKDASCTTYSSGGGSTGDSLVGNANFDFHSLTYPILATSLDEMLDDGSAKKFINCAFWGDSTNCTPFYQDNYGNFTWYNSTTYATGNAGMES